MTSPFVSPGNVIRHTVEIDGRAFAVTPIVAAEIRRLRASEADLLEATQDLLGIILAVCPEYWEAPMCEGARAAILKATPQTPNSQGDQ